MMGSRQKPKLAKAFIQENDARTKTGASSQKDAIGSLVSSRMSDGSVVEYGKKEFVILKLPDVVTSVSFLFPQILLHTTREQRTSFT